MLISEVIQTIKDACKGTWMGQPIDDTKTRDKILYGNPDTECTGIVTTIYASPDVIRKAHELGANLIIAHEALLWNHGDHREWLEESENKVYLAKKKLMDDYGITVWRFHDYIHSGIPHNGGYIDGIFYRVTHKIGNVPVEHFKRASGSSGYTFKKLLNLWLAYWNFSVIPLRVSFFLGIFSAAAGVLIALLVVINKIIYPDITVGWSSTLCVMVLFFGLVLMVLGIVGEYLGKIILILNNTPQYIVRETVNAGSGDLTDMVRELVSAGEAKGPQV